MSKDTLSNFLSYMPSSKILINCLVNFDSLVLEINTVIFFSKLKFLISEMLSSFDFSSIVLVFACFFANTFSVF